MARKPKVPFGSRQCKGCRNWFVPKRKDQVYCLPECRERYYQEHYHIQVTIEKVCPHCHNAFETHCPKKQVYCHPECREAAAVERAQARADAAWASLEALAQQPLIE